MDQFASTDNTQAKMNTKSTNTPIAKPSEIAKKRMLPKPLLIFTFIILVLIITLVVYTLLRKDTDTDQNEDIVVPTLLQGEEVIPTPTAYIDSSVGISNGFRDYNVSDVAYARDGNVVLFFAASWCPTCTKLEADIKNNLSSINPNLLILRVDYDSNPELKSKYGITYQHTLVQIDHTGEELSKWYGSIDLASLQSKVI